MEQTSYGIKAFLIYREIKADVGRILREGVALTISPCCSDSAIYVCGTVHGISKSKSSQMIFDWYTNLKYKDGNLHFWCRDYYSDTVSRNKKAIQNHIQNQLEEKYHD